MNVRGWINDPNSVMSIPSGFSNQSGAYFVVAMNAGKVISMCSSHYYGQGYKFYVVVEYVTKPTS